VCRVPEASLAAACLSKVVARFLQRPPVLGLDDDDDLFAKDDCAEGGFPDVSSRGVDLGQREGERGHMLIFQPELDDSRSCFNHL